MVEAALELPDGRRVPGTFMVDTASRSPLLLTRGFVEEEQLVESLPATLTATTGWGIGGPTRDVVGRARAFELGSLRFDHPIVVCSTARSGVLSERDWAGIIGGEILRRCHVVVDYANGAMTLEPNDNFAEPFEHDQSGLFLVAEGTDLETLRVHDVVPGSPAAEAGIDVGDVITAIDGSPAADLEQAKALFRAGPGTTYAIDVVRAESPLKTELKLRRLV
jgi:membrane-associated protease RseP (regulator of RpoE activity)